MSGRQWFPTAQYTSAGLVYCEFSFLTNGVNDPTPASFRGCGGQTGTDATAGNSNSGPSAVASITRVGQGVGTFLITLQDGYRFVQSVTSGIDDAADSAHARAGNIQNEGAGNATPITFQVFVRNMATNALLETTGRRVSVRACFKNSMSGS